MSPSEYLADYIATHVGEPRLRKKIAGALFNLGGTKWRNDALLDLAECAGYCRACRATGEVETGGRSANDPFRERQTCQECKG